MLVSTLDFALRASIALVYMKSKVAAFVTGDKHVWMLVARRCLNEVLVTISLWPRPGEAKCMCKGVGLNQQTSPVVVELPVERVGEHLRLVAASLQEKSTLQGLWKNHQYYILGSYI